MPDLARDYPELMPEVDQTPGMRTTYREQLRGGERYLVVTQTSEFESGQFLFRYDGTRFRHVASDTVVDIERILEPKLKAALTGTCGPSSPEDHAKVAAEMVRQKDQFSSADGPDGGNLACVWAVRHIAFIALERWITREDGTADFYPELKACMGAAHAIETLPAGAIVISPTEDTPSGRNVGHVGLLGPATTSGDERLIYSNSSSAALWKQNFTVKTWRERYVDRKQLKMFTYPLPLRSSGLTS